MNTDVKTQLSLMQSVVLGNLTQCCQEILDWQNTGILIKTGKIKEAADHLTDDAFSSNKFIHVGNFVKDSAMEFVVSLTKK